MNRLPPSAYHYAKKGIKVFPLAPRTKDQPIGPWKELATTDTKVVLQWWRDNPYYNIGVPTGFQFLVVDLDVKPHLNRDGVEDMAYLESIYEKLPDCPTVQTSRGGLHLFFKMPEGRNIHGHSGQVSLGIDVRAVGNYVVGDGSVHPDTGEIYTWLAGRSIQDLDPPEAPEWLLNLLENPKSSPLYVARKRERKETQPDGTIRQFYVPPEEFLEGTRNTELFAFGRSQMASKGAPVDVQELDARLQGANKSRCKPPFPATYIAEMAVYIFNKPNDPKFQAERDAREANRSADEKKSSTEPNEEALGRDANTIKHVAYDFIWPGRIARKTIAIFEGDPGYGKSTLTIDLTAHVTLGKDWPDGTKCQQGFVIIISAEDSPEASIIPRLMAAGADLSKVRIIETDTENHILTLPDDIPMIEKLIIDKQAVLLIVDPLAAVLPASIDSHRDQAVRRALAPIHGMAGRTNSSVVVVRHLNKSAGGNALYRGGGSIGIIGAARSSFLIAENPDDPSSRIMSCSKINIGKMPESLVFELKPEVVTTKDETGKATAISEVTSVLWRREASPLNSADILNAKKGDGNSYSPHSRDEAMKFLLEELKDGPVASDVVHKDADKLGISESTLKRAAKDLGVRYEKGKGVKSRWFWKLADFQPEAN